MGPGRMIAQANRRRPQRAGFSDFSDVRSCGLGTPADPRGAAGSDKARLPLMACFVSVDRRGLARATTAQLIAVVRWVACGPGEPMVAWERHSVAGHLWACR
mgnify:FL=1